MRTLTPFQAVEEIRQRSVEAILGLSGLNHPALAAEVRRKFGGRDIASGALLQEPILEAAFPFVEAEPTLASLAGTLLHPKIVDALDQPGDPRIGKDWHPYKHQLEAWQYLTAPTPQSILVTSGTGSGKTECFMVPLLDALAREVEALRLGEFLAADMVAVRLTAPFRFVIVGSPAYLARRGRPSVPSDLHGHACIRLRRGNGSFAPWRVRGNSEAVEVAVSGPLVVNDFPSAMGAAAADVGLAQLPERLVATLIENGGLQEVLGQYAPSSEGVFMYFPGRSQVMPKLRAFIDHARANFPQGALPSRP